MAMKFVRKLMIVILEFIILILIEMKASCKFALVEDDLELELADRCIPEALTRDGIVAVVLVEPFQIGLAGDALDHADEEALEARVFRRCVGEGIDRIGRLAHDTKIYRESGQYKGLS